MKGRPRVVILRNPDKPEAESTLDALVTALNSRAEVVGTGTVTDAGAVLDGRPDRVLVLGGDGSILAVARAMGERQVPLVGINFGKLGFLAEFSVEEVQRHLDAVLNDSAIVTRRMMMEVTVHARTGDTARSLAANDCVVHAGPPFRMIELSISVDGDPLTEVSGDGFVLATPNGSTAHNMSVGGPIVESEIQAIVLSPISPHSLTHRPLVVAGESVIEIVARSVHSGSTAVLDGQVSLDLQTGDRLVARRWEHDFQLVRHPAQPKWYTLTQKLGWGRR